MAGGAYREVRRFGADDLSQPFGIAVDRTGLLYVTESDVPYGIAKLTGNGTFVTSWPAVGENPVGIDITPAGQIYTSNFDSDNVQIYGLNGTVGPSFPTSDRPNGLSIGPGGVIHVAFATINAVQTFNLAGDLIATWQGVPYRFSAPFWTAAAPNGDVYVTNQFSREVVWVSEAGEVKGRWGGAEPGQITFPHGITVDTAGYVYVVDRGNFRVQKYTFDGTFVGAFGTFTRDNPAIDVAVARTGMVFMTLPLDQVIVQFEPA